MAEFSALFPEIYKRQLIWWSIHLKKTKEYTKQNEMIKIDMRITLYEIIYTETTWISFILYKRYLSHLVWNKATSEDQSQYSNNILQFCFDIYCSMPKFH